MTLEFTVGLAIWLTLGIMMGLAIDSDEMKKDVPFGEMPSLMSLRQIRLLCVTVCGILGVGIVVAGIIEAVNLEAQLVYQHLRKGYYGLRNRYYIWRIRRRIRHQTKQQFERLLESNMKRYFAEQKERNHDATKS